MIALLVIITALEIILGWWIMRSIDGSVKKHGTIKTINANKTKSRNTKSAVGSGAQPRLQHAVTRGVFSAARKADRIAAQTERADERGA